jgi:L-serine dehydratase
MGTDHAVVLGLMGETPELVDPSSLNAQMASVIEEQALRLLGSHPIRFDFNGDILFRHNQVLPRHPNAMQFAAFDKEGGTLANKLLPRRRVYRHRRRAGIGARFFRHIALPIQERK